VSGTRLLQLPQRRAARAGVSTPWGLAILVGITVALVLVPAYVPHGVAQVIGQPLGGPGSGHIFGLDDQGRDVFSRVLWGMRSSWFAALALIASGIVIGAVVGVTAGMGPRWLDELLMRVTDVFFSLPGPLIALAIVAAIGVGLWHTVIALSVIWWPYYARIFRGISHSLMARPFIEAARLGGIGNLRLAFRHVLPGTRGPILVAASFDMGTVLLTLTGLSFLGLGSAPPSAELGAMTAQGLPYLFTQWWVPVWPGIAVFLLAFASNVSGDSIRDHLER